jgi:sulfonate transport system permease protein
MDAEVVTEAGLIGVLEPNFEPAVSAHPAPERAWTAKDRVRLGRLRTWALSLGAPLALLGAWQLGAQWTQSNLLPPPSVVLGTLSDMLRDGSLLGDLAVSFRRVALGYAWGAGSGALLGLALGFFPAFEEILGPTLDALNQVPIYAYLPLIIVFLGLGELGKVAFIAAGSFYPMLVNAREGARGVDLRHLELAAVYGYSRPQAFWRVLLPEASPFLLSGARTSLGIAWMLVVGAELFGASSGIGYLITWSRQLFQTDGVIVGILAVSATGWALDQGLKVLERRLLAWRKDHGNAWA